MTSNARSRPDDIDRHVGARMRERRAMLGLSQQQLAELIGVTYQQAHKYEKGINRIAAGRLWQIAQVLAVDTNYFFEGFSAGGAPTNHVSLDQRRVLQVAQNFAALQEGHHRHAVLTLTRTLLVSEQESE